VDSFDKTKHSELWQNIFSSQIPGSIKNVYTKKDMILLLYSAGERDSAIGRNALFVDESPKVRNLANPDKTSVYEKLVCEQAFCLYNYDLSNMGTDFLGIGHADYRKNLFKILTFIDE